MNILNGWDLGLVGYEKRLHILLTFKKDWQIQASQQKKLIIILMVSNYDKMETC
jgi:hypothetical protein